MFTHNAPHCISLPGFSSLEADQNLPDITEKEENSSLQKEEETHFLINLWGDSSIQAELQGMYHNKSI